MSVITLGPILELLDLSPENREKPENRERKVSEGGSARDLDLPEPLSGTDRLKSLYDHPGPYASVYLATQAPTDDSAADGLRRWHALRSQMELQGASPQVLDAIEARLALPAPADTAGIAVLAASDGTTIVEHAQDPPREDIAIVDELPYAAPVLEWHQRRIPHLVVTIDENGADIATFGSDHYTRLDSVDGTTAEVSDAVAAVAEAARAELVVVSGSNFAARRLAEDLVAAVPIHCRVVAEPGPGSLDELVEATVRHVADTAARATVGYLRELRYLAAHDSAVDGTADTVAALREHRADVLLIHDDPSDQRRLWIGPEVTDISLESRPGWTDHARLVDAAIRAAICTDTLVHIIPSTGPNGPDDNAAALRRTHAAPPAS